MTSSLSPLAKIRSVPVNIRDLSWHCFSTLLLVFFRELSSQDADVRKKYDVASKVHDDSLQENIRLRKTIASYRSVLEKLGSKMPAESSLPALKPLVKSFEIVTPNIMARATVYSQVRLQLSFNHSTATFSPNGNTLPVFFYLSAQISIVFIFKLVFRFFPKHCLSVCLFP